MQSDAKPERQISDTEYYSVPWSVQCIVRDASLREIWTIMDTTFACYKETACGLMGGIVGVAAYLAVLLCT